ncbi:MAG: acyl-CoA thioesterase [Fibrobacterales bacterium]
MNSLYSDTPLKIEFFDLDPMNIVWHGNYIKYYEQARRTLLDYIGYGYKEMKESGYAWPVVKSSSKYIHPITYGDVVSVRATLAEYENRIRITYIFFNPETKKTLHKGETVQMCVDIKTGISLFASPDIFVEKVTVLQEKSLHA